MDSESLVPTAANQSSWRETNQPLLPARLDRTECAWADMFPTFPVVEGGIELGWTALAEKLEQQSTVLLDGYNGVFWQNARSQLDAALVARGKSVHWISMDTFRKPSETIEALAKPFLGGDDPLFGTRCTKDLADFLDMDALRRTQPNNDADLTILYGSGAALSEWDSFVVFLDVPKNEIQFRSRAGAVSNLFCDAVDNPKRAYKRFYFVDWPLLNAHKRAVLPRIDSIVDEQRPDEPTFLDGHAFRQTLEQMAKNWLRVRPWFEPGPWGGGQWIKESIPDLPRDVPNYAWSFELIVPENGLLLASHDLCLEASFDFLMYQNHRAVLGDRADEFGTEFPVRFDFLDTMGGGNLSVQCHPRVPYARKYFGEAITQDETYYILDCGNDAEVYLGFNEGVDPQKFREALEHSQHAGQEIDITQFVNVEPAHKHDLFLIPNGTIHCSGANNMVLEISSTPYIFTFKMYDWMRRDLQGNLRPLNIDRAFENLYFDRQGDRIAGEFVSHPSVLEAGDDWELIHVPTHAEHFYDVHRIEFDSTVEAKTDGSFHVMMLVEGAEVLLKTQAGMEKHFRYAETFVVPAAAGAYTLTNESKQKAKVIKCFLKS